MSYKNSIIISFKNILFSRLLKLLKNNKNLQKIKNKKQRKDEKGYKGCRTCRCSGGNLVWQLLRPISRILCPRGIEMVTDKNRGEGRRGEEGGRKGGRGKERGKWEGRGRRGK